MPALLSELRGRAAPVPSEGLRKCTRLGIAYFFADFRYRQIGFGKQASGLFHALVRDVVGWRQSRCRFEEVFQLCLPYVELVCQARAGQVPSKVRGNVSADEIDGFAVFASQGYAAMLFGAERRMLHDERDDFRDHPFVEELRRHPRALVASSLLEQVDEIRHVMPSVGFQEGSSHVPNAPEPALQVGAVVVRGKGNRRAPCRRAFGNVRLVLFALSSEIYRDRSDAERRSLLLRHSVDFVVERNAKMFGAPIPQDSVFLECHSE